MELGKDSASWPQCRPGRDHVQDEEPGRARIDGSRCQKLSVVLWSVVKLQKRVQSLRRRRTARTTGTDVDRVKGKSDKVVVERAALHSELKRKGL